MTQAEIQGMADAVTTAKSYADAILKAPLEQVGGLLADTAGYWRLKNRVNVLLKAKRYCEERGVDPAKILPDVFVPLVDEAGNTDDETLSDMFARLLAAHLDPTGQDVVHPSFAKILAQMGPLDARILLMLKDKEDEDMRRRREAGGVLSEAVANGNWEGYRFWTEKSVVDEARKRFNDPNLPAACVKLSVCNLTRLGLIAYRDFDVDLADTEAACRRRMYGLVVESGLGRLFVGAVTGRERNDLFFAHEYVHEVFGCSDDEPAEAVMERAKRRLERPAQPVAAP